MSARAILLSIHPRHTTAILEGRKTVELRRVLPADDTVKRCLLYATAPTKLLVGEVAIVGRFDLPIDEAWCLIGSEAAVGHDEFKRYFAGRAQASGLLLGGPVFYPEPIDPRDESLAMLDRWAEHGLEAPDMPREWRAPQSWRYWPVTS